MLPPDFRKDPYITYLHYITLLTLHRILTLLTYLLLRFFFQLYLGTCARAVLCCARALFVHLIDVCLAFGSLNNVLILLCIIFLTHIYVLSVTVLALWVAPPEMFCNWYRI